MPQKSQGHRRQRHKQTKALMLKFLILIVLLLGVSLHAQAAEGTQPSACNETRIIFGADDVAIKQNIVKQIAFMKTELGVTPAEEEFWTPLANAIRDNAADMQKDRTHVSDQMYGHENAIDYQQSRVLFANLGAQCETRFLTALQPLYDHLSVEQKQAADDLLVPANMNTAVKN